MNRVLIELGKTHLEYFIEGEVPTIGDILNLDSGESVEVCGRKFSFEYCYRKDNRVIRRPTIKLIVKDLY